MTTLLKARLKKTDRQMKIDENKATEKNDFILMNMIQDGYLDFLGIIMLRLKCFDNSNMSKLTIMRGSWVSGI